MIELLDCDLDERERLVAQDADSFWAVRFLGVGRFDRLGPFTTQEQAVLQARQFFKDEDAQGLCPPPKTIAIRPFLIYACASKHANAQIPVGNVYRDGIERPTYREFQQRRNEKKAVAAKSRRRGNPERPA
jgi:hypothetical protein